MPPLTFNPNSFSLLSTSSTTMVISLLLCIANEQDRTFSSDASISSSLFLFSNSMVLSFTCTSNSSCWCSAWILFSSDSLITFSALVRISLNISRKRMAKYTSKESGKKKYPPKAKYNASLRFVINKSLHSQLTKVRKMPTIIAQSPSLAFLIEDKIMYMQIRTVAVRITTSIISFLKKTLLVMNRKVKISMANANCFLNGCLNIWANK